MHLLFNPHAKWYNVHRNDNFLGILRNLEVNYFSKTSLVGSFKMKSDISLKSVPQQGGKITRANHRAKHGKIRFFCMISTTLTKTGGGGGHCFIL